MHENKASTSLQLLSTFGGAPRSLTRCGDKDGEAKWSPRADRIAFVAKREQESAKDDEPQLYLIPVDGGEARRVTHLATGVSGIKWFADGKRVAFISWVWPDAKGHKEQAARHKAFKERKETAYVTDAHLFRYWDHNLPMGRVPHLFVVDVDSGKITDLMEGSDFSLSLAEPSASSYDIAPDGKSIVFSYDPEPVKRVLDCFALGRLEVKSRKIAPLLQVKGWDFSAPRFAHDGKRLACIASHRGKRHTAPEQLAVLDLATGDWSVLSQDFDHDIASVPAWAEDDSAILFVAEERGRSHVWRFDLASRAAAIVAQGGTVQGFDLAGGTLVWLADSMTHPVRAYMLDDAGKAQRIESFNDGLLKDKALGKFESVTYPGALVDGKREDAQMWVIYPPGFNPKKKYPLLHSIHGGPHAASADGFHYRWNNQVFASGNGGQDYVVVCVNYHGSTGFGQAYKDSITHRWGELELQDVEAATDHMLKKPYIDAKRVYATGGSYGGYMVAWMNGHCAPGRYKAYVCHAGCFDWVSMFASDGAEWFKAELGAWYWDDMAKVHAQSPHAYAKNFSSPTLVIHGQLDYRVPDAQGLAYYSTLKAQNIDARLVWFPDENHWVLKPRNSKLWYAEFFGWLKKHGGR
jgi:dipeptidyl aminopeptidase/acylaminoacyl peptidase